MAALKIKCVCVVWGWYCPIKWSHRTGHESLIYAKPAIGKQDTTFANAGIGPKKAGENCVLCVSVSLIGDTEWSSPFSSRHACVLFAPRQGKKEKTTTFHFIIKEICAGAAQNLFTSARRRPCFSSTRWIVIVFDVFCFTFFVASICTETNLPQSAGLE